MGTEDEIKLVNHMVDYLTVDLPEHGRHVLKVVMVKEPYSGVTFVFIKWDCRGESVHQNVATTPEWY